MEVGKAFNNLSSYNEKMARSLQDKMFFLDHLPEDEDFLFVDFGCADGTMINALYEIYSRKDNNVEFVGYDVSDAMIDLARCRFDNPVPNVMFTTDWADVIDKLNEYRDYTKVLILSSVIHEVYSYAENEKDIFEFWHHIHESYFDYICIRDMMPSSDINRPTHEVDMQHLKSTVGLSKNMWKLIEEFEGIWGSCENNENMIHFLLKYRYTVNWNREVHENYFPIYIEDFIEQMTKQGHNSNYKINYLERFRVPFLVECIKKDFFGLTLQDFTHVKMIFEIRK